MRATLHCSSFLQHVREKNNECSGCAASLAWRWKRTAHAAHVEAMLLMDSPAMKLGQVVT